MHRSGVFVLIAGIAASAFAQAPPDPDAMLDPRLVGFFSAPSLKTIRNARCVRAQRVLDDVNSISHPRLARGLSKGAGPRLPPGECLSDELADALREVLLDGHSYELPPATIAGNTPYYEAGKLCRAVPVMRFYFHPDQAMREPPLMVQLAFNCDELGLQLTASQQAALRSYAEASELGRIDVSSGRNRLLRVVRAMWPRDEELANISGASVLKNLRFELERAVRVEAAKVARPPLERDAFHRWRQLPRRAQAANLYEVEGDPETLSDDFRVRAAALLQNEAMYETAELRAGDGLAKHALRFVFDDPRRKGETAVDVLIAPGFETIEIGQVVSYGGLRTIRHVVDGRFRDPKALEQLLGEAFPGEKFGLAPLPVQNTPATEHPKSE